MTTHRRHSSPTGYTLLRGLSCSPSTRDERMTLVSESGGAAPRVAVVSTADARDPSLWSGTPRGLVDGLTEAGAVAVVIPCDPPQSLRRPLVAGARVRYRDATTANRQPLVCALRSRLVDARLRRAHVDAFIALSTELYVPSIRSLPWATYDDMTHEQARRNPFSELNWYPSTRTATWARRQAAASRRATACCTMTAWAARSMQTDYGVDPDRTHVVGLGCRRPRLQDPDRDWSIPRFLFVGQDWRRKNGDAVLRAFRRLRATDPTATLDLVGGHPSVDEPGVTGHGRLALDDPRGQARLDALYASATCLVLPSHLEPSALAYIEAGRAGIPSIGTSEGGSSELIGPGGLVVAPDDERQLLSAMRTLSDPGRARHHGRLAQTHSDAFTWPAVARRILRLLLPPGSGSARDGMNRSVLP